MLSVEKITYSNTEDNLLSQISFNLLPCEMIQIIGPNGAGKSTLLKLIAGLLKIEEGSITWNNKDIYKNSESYRAEILYQGHHSGVKHQLMVKENLQFFSTLADTNNLLSYDEILAIVGLSEVANCFAGQLSAGQQRRLSLARLWFSQAKLWLLDEPLTALDRSFVEILKQKIKEFLEADGCVVMATHHCLDLPDFSMKLLELA